MVAGIQTSLEEPFPPIKLIGHKSNRLTSLGIDNTGKLVLPYGKEDADYYVDGDPSSTYVYRAAESTFFCRLRDLFESELQAMFVDRESKNAWSANSLITQWDDYQNQFPEELWRLDIQRKYLRTYLGTSIDNSIAGAKEAIFLPQMMNGRKKYQRRMFERNQELYMATKYFGTTATQDQIRVRFNNPESYVVKPDFALHITPYSDMYIGVSFYNGHKENFRAKAGIEYKVNYPEGLDTADITLIYGASFIQAIGDLSKCYIGDNDFTKATRLQSLVIGSDIEGYANTYMAEIKLANNKLLEYLDVRNVTGLSSTIDLSQCGNMLELRAEGSGAKGVIFANGGKIQKFYLPSITSLTAKNLNYIEDFNIENYINLQTLVVENTPAIDTHEIVDTTLDIQSSLSDGSAKLNVLRLIGIDWDIENKEILDEVILLRGQNSSGGETMQSVLAGTVAIPTIGAYDKQKYEEVWNDLTIIPKDGVIPQYKVTFMNEDGTELDVQYIDQYGNAVDPITREENPISIPTKESTVKYSYAFAGWDKTFTNIIDNINVYATYTESIREYTIQYVSMGTPIYTTTGKYGTNIEYVGDVPTYTLAEPTAFYLFKRWNKSGFLLEGENGTDLDTGTKIVTAEFDTFQYSANAFAGKDFSELKPVEIYALSRLTDLYKTSPSDYGMNIAVGDKYSFEMGYDIDYDDIESSEIISNKQYYNGTDYVSAVFDGSNYIDTGIKLFDEDKDFVLAVDYKIASDNSSDGTFMQCYQTSGSHGFKLVCSSGTPEFIWGDASTMKPCSVGSREMIVLRHIKGDNNLYVYTSNLDSTAFNVNELTKGTTTTTIYDTTLVFGQQKTDGNAYRNGCKGEIMWCKIWYKDLGEDICKKLVGWTHEKISLSVDGFKRYSLHDDPTKEVMISLVADHLLDRTKPWKSSGTTGGWASSSLREFLNTRFYEAIPTQIKSLMKKMSVGSTIGDKSTTVDWSDCYVTIPSVYDLDTSKTESKNELYDTNNPISIMQTNDTRKRGFDGGDYYDYWTRSPNISFQSYAWFVVDGVNDNNNLAGSLYGIRPINTKMGVLIEISF